MREEIEREIARFISEEVLEESEGSELPVETPLLSGLLDSFGLMTLIGFLEERFDLIIKNDQVVKKNFESISALAAFVAQGRDDRATVPVETVAGSGSG